MGVETIICNANVLTMDGSGPSCAPQALAIDSGRIIALGATGDIAALADADTLELDLRGRTVLPGFIDAHVHFTQTGLCSLGPKVYGLTSRSGVLEIVADAIARTGESEPAPGDRALHPHA